MVAPSFVTVTSPISSTSILSNPTGPKELFTMFAMEHAAITENKWNSFWGVTKYNAYTQSKIGYKN